MSLTDHEVLYYIGFTLFLASNNSYLLKQQRDHHDEC